MRSNDVALLLNKVLSSDIDWDAHYYINRTVEFLENNDFAFDSLKTKQIQSEPDFLTENDKPSNNATPVAAHATPTVVTARSNSWLTF